MFCAFFTAMAVINREKRAVWPIFDILFRLGSHNVKNDANPIFIVIPDQSAVSVSGIRAYDVIFLLGMLRTVQNGNLKGIIRFLIPINRTFCRNAVNICVNF